MRFVECHALGRHASNDVLVEGNEIVIFGAHVAEGLGAEPANVWVYDKAHLVRMHEHCSLAPARSVVGFK